MADNGFEPFIVDFGLRTVFALAACEVGSRRGLSPALCAILGFLGGPIGLLAAAIAKRR